MVSFFILHLCLAWVDSANGQHLTTHTHTHTQLAFCNATMSNAWTENRSDHARADNGSICSPVSIRAETHARARGAPELSEVLHLQSLSPLSCTCFIKDSPETAAPVNRESDAPRCFKVRLRLRVRSSWCAIGSAVPLMLKRDKSGGSGRRTASEEQEEISDGETESPTDC